MWPCAEGASQRHKPGMFPFKQLFKTESPLLYSDTFTLQKVQHPFKVENKVESLVSAHLDSVLNHIEHYSFFCSFRAWLLIFKVLHASFKKLRKPNMSTNLNRAVKFAGDFRWLIPLLFSFQPGCICWPL